MPYSIPIKLWCLQNFHIQNKYLCVKQIRADHIVHYCIEKNKLKLIVNSIIDQEVDDWL